VLYGSLEFVLHIIVLICFDSQLQASQYAQKRPILPTFYAYYFRPRWTLIKEVYFMKQSAFSLENAGINKKVYFHHSPFITQAHFTKSKLRVTQKTLLRTNTSSFRLPLTAAICKGVLSRWSSRSGFALCAYKQSMITTSPMPAAMCKAVDPSFCK